MELPRIYIASLKLNGEFPVEKRWLGGHNPFVFGLSAYFHRLLLLVLGRIYHESWIFPAGVSFALKQNMYWDGFCAFLPDISGLWGGGGGPKPCKNQQI